MTSPNASARFFCARCRGNFVLGTAVDEPEEIPFHRAINDRNCQAKCSSDQSRGLAGCENRQTPSDFGLTAEQAAVFCWRRFTLHEIPHRFTSDCYW